MRKVRRFWERTSTFRSLETATTSMERGCRRMTRRRLQCWPLLSSGRVSRSRSTLTTSTMQSVTATQRSSGPPRTGGGVVGGGEGASGGVESTTVDLLGRGVLPVWDPANPVPDVCHDPG
ncbi:unnamed protein product, partial [Pylaiella littoralis]